MMYVIQLGSRLQKFIFFSLFAVLPLQTALGSDCSYFLLTASTSYQIQSAQSIDPKWLGGYGLGTTRVSDYDDSNYDHSVSFESAGPELKKTHGARIIIRRKSGRGWYSGFGPFENALQGDPRSPFLILGRELATVLGYQMLDQNTVVFPTTERLNWGIQLVNSWLVAENKQPLPYTFYEQGTDLETKFRRLLRKYKLPINEDNLALAVHDHVFHVSELFEPIETQQRILALDQFFSSYLSFVKKQFSEKEYEEATAEINTLVDALVANISTTIYKATIAIPDTEDGRIGLSERSEDNLTLQRIVEYDHGYLSMLKHWTEFEKARERRIERFQDEFEMLSGEYLTGEVFMFFVMQRRREVSGVVRKNIQKVKTTSPAKL